MATDWTALQAAALQTASLQAALETSGATCLYWRDGQQILSQENGVRPLLHWLRQDPKALQGVLIADKVVGKAAALLIVYGGVAGVYAGVLSEPAAAVLTAAGIPFTAGARVARIRNRAGDGLCPMEARVLAVDDPEQAYRVLSQAVFGDTEPNKR